MTGTAGCLVGLAEWRLPATGVVAVRLAAEIGADGVQLDFGGPGRTEWLDAPGRVDALRAAAREHDVALLAVAGNHLNDVGLAAPVGTPDGGRVRALVTRILDTAVALGVGLAFLPSFRRSAIDGPAAFAGTADLLAWAAAEAEGRGLLLGSENVLPAEHAVALAEKVGSPAFRLVLDSYNPVEAGLRPAGLVGAAGHLLADQVHLKDGPPSVGTTPPLGAGTGALADTLDALAANQVPVRALVLENDYRKGKAHRLTADLSWARKQAGRFVPISTEEK
ncbi:sugar phosphate isomerase/epimerase [Frankia sp. CiP3]|uniref:sugar phosphate isomerase/epimerase family protein n=1 Tax=Frankia sp. CiP3 TaxID=2880971 RepID=UPI001EF6140E|nr:TIM barrel protein [Frankia sp. CiP3]